MNKLNPNTMYMGYKKSSTTRFEDTSVWRDAIDLAEIVYLLTKKFPRDELFALTSQMRRASTSVSANIAEGFGRTTKRDKVHFYTMSYGSLLELKSFMYLALRLKLCTDIKKETMLIENIQNQINAIRYSLK